jgi:hypothetical protein
VYDHKKDHPYYSEHPIPGTYDKGPDGQLLLPHVEILREATRGTFRRLFSGDGPHRILDYPTFVHRLWGMMTSNSSGMGGVTVKMKLGKEISFSTTSKSLIFALSPDTFRPPPTLDHLITAEEDAILDPPYTEEQPGLYAQRSVPYKPTRPVEMQTLIKYNKELRLYRPAYMDMADKDATASDFAPIIWDINGPRFNSNVFTVGTETGNIVLDHMDEIRYTGNCQSTGAFVFQGEDTDYSSYDESEVEFNTRRPIRDGTIQAFHDVYGDAPFPPYDSFETFINSLLPSTPQPFITPGGVVVHLGGIRSGELPTAYFNNLMNAAVNHVVQEKVIGMGIARPVLLRIQGDDVKSVYMVPKGYVDYHLAGDSDFDRELYDEVAGLLPSVALPKVITMVVNRCGIETNINKGVGLPNVMDYLKVRVAGGVVSPNGYAQAWGAESVGIPEDPIAFLAGQFAKLDMMVGRGWDPELMWRFSLALFVIRGSWKVSVPNPNENYSYMYYPPIIQLFSPTFLGGLGRAPFPCPVAADMLLVYMAKTFPAYMQAVTAASVGYKPPATTDVARSIADRFMAADKRHDFTIISKLKRVQLPSKALAQPFALGIADVSASLDPDAIQRSKASARELKNKRYQIHADLSYFNSPKRVVHDVIRTNPKVMQTAAQYRVAISEDEFKSRKPPEWSDAAKWVWTANIVIEDPIPFEPDHDGPLRFMHGWLGPLMTAMGWGCANPDLLRRVSSLINMIKRDPLFPRDITDDRLVAMLFNVDVVEDPSLIPHILYYIGCTPDTVAKVIAAFSGAAMNAVLLQSIAGEYSLKSPLTSWLDLSVANVSKFVHDRANTRSSRAMMPPMTSLWMCMCFATGRLCQLSYHTTLESDNMVSRVQPSLLIPYTPIFESDHKYIENRGPKDIYRC